MDRVFWRTVKLRTIELTEPPFPCSLDVGSFPLTSLLDLHIVLSVVSLLDAITAVGDDDDGLELKQCISARRYTVYITRIFLTLL